MKHILVASLGGAPQVITETLWAMMNPDRLFDPAHRDRKPVAPEEIHILATSFYMQPFSSVEERNAAIREKIGVLYAQYGRKPPHIAIEAVTDASPRKATISLLAPIDCPSMVIRPPEAM